MYFQIFLFFLFYGIIEVIHDRKGNYHVGFTIICNGLFLFYSYHNNDMGHTHDSDFSSSWMDYGSQVDYIFHSPCHLAFSSDILSKENQWLSRSQLRLNTLSVFASSEVR